MVTKPHATDAVDVDRLITELLEHLLSSDEEKKNVTQVNVCSCFSYEFFMIPEVTIEIFCEKTSKNCFGHEHKRIHNLAVPTSKLVTNNNN